MKLFLIFIYIMFNFLKPTYASYDKLAYDFTFTQLNGESLLLEEYKEKIIIVVNVASRCGFTNQYEGLQKISEKYKDQLVVIGVPSNNFKQEPGSNKDIKDFCETNFGVTFPMTEKTDVVGKNAHPFFKWANKNHGVSAIPKWNFHKIIINKDGKVGDTFSSITKPSSAKFVNFIEKEIKN
jgi:glutathione peroxidase